MNLSHYGITPAILAQAGDAAPARVTAVHKERFELVSPYGHGYGRLKAGAYYNNPQALHPTVGDFVTLQHNPQGDSLILATLPRRSVFTRRDPDRGRGEQAVAANFDTVLILQSLNHDFNPKRLERYLTQAWQSGALPVVVLTKADLSPDYSEQARAAEAMAPGVSVLAVSARTGQGLTALAPFLAGGQTAVLLGSSGVGKSSLVNALAGEALMDVRAVREDDSKGRHTTTHRQLILLPSGGMVIDTPGMRSLGMWDVTQGLDEAFEDVEQHLGRCRFADCTHQSEPGCAVQEALARGELTPERWKSYLRLKREAMYSGDPEAYMRERTQRHKDISRYNKHNLRKRR